jgi:predicted nucleic acid-binding protein
VIAHVDTSVLLRVVLGESSPLRQWRSIRVAVSSELIRVEALRCIDRARVLAHLADTEVAERRASVLSLLDGFHLAALNRDVLRRAADPFPTLVRTRDAIHLATALLARTVHDELVFATHDARRRARARRAVGLDVIGARVPRSQ